MLGFGQGLPLTITKQEPAACALCVPDTGPTSTHASGTMPRCNVNIGRGAQLDTLVLTLFCDASSNPGCQVGAVLGFAPHRPVARAHSPMRAEKGLSSSEMLRSTGVRENRTQLHQRRGGGCELLHVFEDSVLTRNVPGPRKRAQKGGNRPPGHAPAEGFPRPLRHPTASHTGPSPVPFSLKRLEPTQGCEQERLLSIFRWRGETAYREVLNPL